MKSFIPLTVTLLGAALAAPLATENIAERADTAETAKRDPTNYFVGGAWGKRDAEEHDVKRDPTNYFVGGAWGKRTENEKH